MTHRITSGSNEEKILRLIMKKYPITNMDVARTTGLKLDRVNLILVKLEKRGIITLEVLPDVWYIRLRDGNIRFEGVNPSQQKKLKHKKRKKKELLKKRDTYDGMMYQ